MKSKDILLLGATLLISFCAIAMGQSELFPGPDQDNSTRHASDTMSDDNGPQSPAAKDARRKYDLAINTVKESYSQSVLKADQQYISDLAALVKATMNGGPSMLEEATRLDAARIAAINAMEEHQKSQAQRSVNLLKLIDPKVDVVGGNWTMKDGTLVTDGGDWNRIEIPYQPPEEYDFRVVFSHSDNTSMICYAGGHQFLWMMGSLHGTLCGFDLVNGIGAGNPKNETSVYAKQWLVNDQRYVCVLKVRKDGVAAYLDDKLVVKWKTDYHDASLFGDMGLHDGNALALSGSAKTVFESVELIEITGTGTPLRPDPASVKQSQDTAPEDPPHSAAAKEARRKYDLEAKLAMDAYRKGLVGADQQYISELDGILKGAMNDGALEEAKRLEAARIAAIDAMEEHKQEGLPHKVNLLKFVDPKVDAIRGNWQAQNGELGTEGGEWSRIEIPYQPPEEYDFRVVFKRLSDSNQVDLICSAGGHQFLWMMGALSSTLCSFDQVNGLGAGNPGNKTSVYAKPWIVNGQQYVCLLKVRKGGVEAYLNNKLISQWKTDYHDASLFGEMGLHDGNALGLGSSSKTIFQSAELIEITGSGKPLRPAGHD